MRLNLGRLTRKVDGRGWPQYLLGGRIRTSTAALFVAFIVLFWAYQTFQPQATGPQAPTAQVVPPGFVPDPDYTWVPRTQVQTAPRRTTVTTPTTTTPTTTTPTTTSPTETPSTSLTSPTPTTPSEPTTTVIDPDGNGPLPPLTLTLPPGLPSPATAPAGPAPVPASPGAPR